MYRLSHFPFKVDAFRICCLLAILFVNLTGTALAQPKDKKVVSDEYDRNALSIIVVNRGDSWDPAINDFLEKLDIGDKFDINDIPTKVVTYKMTDRRNPIGQEAADQIIRESGVAKEVLAYVFNRQSDGSMDDALLRERGLYNATDQDILNASAAKVSEQYLSWGEKLIDNSYVAILDFWNLIREESTNAGITSVNYQAWIFACVYKLECDLDKLEEFYNVAWADAQSSPSQKAAARKGFDEFQVNCVPVATVIETNASTRNMMDAITSILTLQGNTNTTIYGAMMETYGNIMRSLEKKIPAWNVAVPIISTHPLQAKVGEKEGLRNGQRYRAYTYAEDKNGKLVSQGKGYLRATRIADNRGVATGSSAASEFCQISGLEEIQEGWTIRQSNDVRLSVALEPRIGGLSHFSVNLDLDYLLRISTSGNCFYPSFSIGVDPETFRSAQDARSFGFIVGVGAAYGFRLNRLLELAPYVMGGMDFQAARQGRSGSGEGVFYIEPGARFTVSFYPFTLYAKGFFDLLRSGGDVYRSLNETLPHPHKNGVGVAAGVRWSF